MIQPFQIFLICIGALALICAVAFFVHFSNSSLVVTSYNEKCLQKLEKSVKICQVSDLHAKEFGKGNAKLLSLIKEGAPDVIVITGDIIHKYRNDDISVALKFVENAVKIAPVLFVSGNHEMRNKRYKDFAKQLANAGATVLDNACMDVCGIRFCGLNCAHLKNDTIFSLNKSEGYSVLLAHKPEYLYRYALAKFDLVLSGHAHGGQWRLPITKQGVYSPGQGLFPKYTSGVHTSGNTRMIISRGLGNSQFPLRLFNRPELVFITLEN